MAESPTLAGSGGAGGEDSRPPDDDVNITHQARSILKISRDTEFLHSFLRVDHGDSDSESGDAPRLPGGAAAAQKGGQGGSDDRADGESTGAGAGRGGAAEVTHHADGPPNSRRHHKATFKEVVKDLEMYGGLGALAGMRKGLKGRRSRVIRGEEVYTDKDRAAAVQMGHRDIKQSLRMKRHQERVHALQLPEEADGSTLLALGQYELRQGNTDIAIAFVNKALQLCPEDKTALVARSKCYLLLGQPRLALQDAETALGPDRNFVRAILQKAEALYHMGDFEHSLMYYHRGLRLRPELASFRLGVQKAQEAIENTIGTGIEESCEIMEAMERAKSSRPGSKGSMRARLASTSPGGPGGPRPAVVTTDHAEEEDADDEAPTARVTQGTLRAATPTSPIQPTLTAPGSARSRSSRSSRSSRDNRYTSEYSASSSGGDEEQSARRLLGELCVDKLYLEQLLKHPDIRCARKDRNRGSQIAVHAEDGVEFLRNRQEFWRQQKLSTGPGGISVGGSGPSGKRRTATPVNNSSADNSGRSSSRLATTSPQTQIVT